MNILKFTVVFIFMCIAGSIIALDSYCRRESAECPVELMIEDEEE